MNNVNNASHAERRCRIMRRNYGKRYRQTTKVILEVFAPWWITTPTTSRTEKRKSDRRSQTRPEHLWSGKTRVEKKFIYRRDSAYPKKSRNIQRKKNNLLGQITKILLLLCYAAINWHQTSELNDRNGATEQCLWRNQHSSKFPLAGPGPGCEHNSVLDKELITISRRVDQINWWLG